MDLGKYFTTHYIKVKFCMQEFSIKNITSHRFCVNNAKVEIGIGYNMIIGRDLFLQLGLIAELNYNNLECYSAIVPTKCPLHRPGKPNIFKNNI